MGTPARCPSRRRRLGPLHKPPPPHPWLDPGHHLVLVASAPVSGLSLATSGPPGEGRKRALVICGCTAKPQCLRPTIFIQSSLLGRDGPRSASSRDPMDSSSLPLPSGSQHPDTPRPRRGSLKCRSCASWKHPGWLQAVSPRPSPLHHDIIKPPRPTLPLPECTVTSQIAKSRFHHRAWTPARPGATAAALDAGPGTPSPGRIPGRPAL